MSVEASAAVLDRRRGGVWRRRTRALVGTRATAISAAILVAIVAYCVFWPMIAPYGASEVDLARTAQGPSLHHPLGTDQLGRDLLTRLAAGGRNTLLIAGMALAIILIIGVAYGTTAAMAGPKLDNAMMRIVDGLFAIPRIVVAIVILVALKLQAANIQTIAFALGIVGWMLTARLVRGQVLSLKTRDYVTAARSLGASGKRIAARHLIPNTSGIILVAVLLELPTVIIGEAFLAVVGLGPAPPAATWGNIAKDGVDGSNAWMMLWPSVIIALFALSANVLVDRLHDVLDPRREGA